MPNALLPNIVDFISKVDPFDKLPTELQQQVAGMIKISYLAKGERLQLDGEPDGHYLHIVHTGAMEQRHHDGSLRAKLGPEDSFGFTFLEPVKELFRGYSAVAIANTLLYSVPHQQLQPLLADHPDSALHFAASAQERLFSAIRVKWSSRDKGLFVRKVSDIASNQVVTVDANDSIQQVAQQMRQQGRAAMAVVLEQQQIVGVITDGDMTKRVVAAATDIQQPVRVVMTSKPHLVDPDELVISAVSVMMEHNLRCLPVVRDNQVVGQLSSSHLVQNHRVQALFLLEKMKTIDNRQQLIALAIERQAVFEALVEGKVNAPVIGKVMALLMDGFNRRLIELAIEQLGPPPCEFAWLVAGSHARQEVHYASDQDSAIVFSDDASDADRDYFLALGQWVCSAMAECGYASCDGDFMASNPKWCQPLASWQQYYREWVEEPEQNQLLNATVFLEVRSLYGQANFCEQLQTLLFDQIASNSGFLPALVQTAVAVQPPLGIFNKLVLEKGGEHSNTLNIKKHALSLLIDLARIYGLAVGCRRLDTEQRFVSARRGGRLDKGSCKDVIGALRFISQVRYEYQLKRLKQGLPVGNHISPDAIGSFDRSHLKDAFRIIATFQESAKLRFLG
ncbi:DUF294 nucleotidyltransferase-like domain-containing protein [Ferrimonas senticii]|uniref:DUF294 nucleotidyltransferase-like domain-containing protein n=1 Tax=Ferrimonas senticii TaxID=394566 RepID=UPI0004124822|nr:DUF294 nucleotidyltransferase-like domain-containing protein [Ferrimonas senticii]